MPHGIPRLPQASDLDAQVRLAAERRLKIEMERQRQRIEAKIKAAPPSSWGVVCPGSFAPHLVAHFMMLRNGSKFISGTCHMPGCGFHISANLAAQPTWQPPAMGGAALHESQLAAVSAAVEAIRRALMLEERGQLPAEAHPTAGVALARILLQRALACLPEVS